MATAVLVDTNVLVYAEDMADPDKQERAERLLDDLMDDGAALLTAQVLAEFSAVACGKLSTVVPLDLVEALIDRYVALVPVLPVTAQVVREALRAVRQYRMHYYDAQLWATAKLAGVRTVLSEDFAGGTEIEGVRFVDPFAEGFDVQALLSGST